MVKGIIAMQDEELRSKAEKIATEKIGFQVHFTIYIAVNLSLIAGWYFTGTPHGTSFPWFLFPLVGWGIGILAHFLGAYYGEPHKAVLAEREYRKLKNRE